MLVKRRLATTIPIAQSRACVLVAALLFSPLANGQLAPNERPQRPVRPGMPRVIPRGMVLAFTNSTIILGNPVPARGIETTFPVLQGVVISSLKPIKQAEITQPKWVTVYRQPGPAGSDQISVMWLKAAAAKPADEAAGKEPLPPLALRREISGMLKMNGTNATLQCEGRDIPLKFTELTPFYQAVPAVAADVKPGTEVLLDFRVSGGKFLVKGIDIVPPGEGPPGIFMRPTLPPPPPKPEQ